jgi:hypothetical protein
MGRVRGLDLHLVDVEVGQGATITLTDLSYYDVELLRDIGYAENDSIGF